MKTVNFCFGTHNHQPIGNFDYVIEEAYQKSYLPFFELASRHDVPFASHFSGILLGWLEKNHPEQINLLKKMVSNRQLEIISGGYYEPILAVISRRDRNAQITKLTNKIGSLFGSMANGLWLAERVWEQQLAGDLANAGIQYVILDDTHFRAAGLSNEDLTGYYLTEDGGSEISVFPISKELRYTIPFAEVDETIAVLRDGASESGTNLITFADDGEKFGVWPSTFEHVYEDGWLEEFFAKLSENRSWINIIRFSDALKTIQPKGRIYLPNASYAEMMQWALPTAKASAMYEDFTDALSAEEEKWGKYMQFVRGGFWRNFFVKYPESDRLHKRVLQLSKKFEDATVAIPEEAYEHLLASQCNDAYWHGVFGGIYLPNLRHEVYANLISAEKTFDTVAKKKEITTETGMSQGTLVHSDIFTLVFDHSRGGAISEISFKPKAFNISNFINRIPEAYHTKLNDAAKQSVSKGSKSIHEGIQPKEEGLEEYLIYDWYRHGSFIEHFLSEDTSADDLRSMNFLEYGDFLGATVFPVISSDGKAASIEFSRKGSVFTKGASQDIHLTKKLEASYGSGRLSVSYLIENTSDTALDLRFGSEWTFGLLAGDAHDRYFESHGLNLTDDERKLRSSGEMKNTDSLSLVDEWAGLRIDLSFEEPVTIWRAPIESVASSEAGLERVYQGSIVLPLWELSLAPSAEKSIHFDLIVSEL
jgi:alpha-amylase